LTKLGKMVRGREKETLDGRGLRCVERRSRQARTRVDVRGTVERIEWDRVRVVGIGG